MYYNVSVDNGWAAGVLKSSSLPGREPARSGQRRRSVHHPPKLETEHGYVRSQGLSITFRHAPSSHGPLAMGANEVLNLEKHFEDGEISGQHPYQVVSSWLQCQQWDFP